MRAVNYFILWRTLPGSGAFALDTDLAGLCTNITRMWIIASVSLRGKKTIDLEGIIPRDLSMVTYSFLRLICE
jgi:hypothetical protein